MSGWLQEQMKTPDFANAFAAAWIGETIATAMEDRMKELRMTKKQLAGRLRCSPANVSRWFTTPHAMSLSTVARLFRVLELDVAVVQRVPGGIQ